jgi:hypothetical protein
MNLRLRLAISVAALVLPACAADSDTDSDDAETVGVTAEELGRAGVCDARNIDQPDCSFLAFGIGWNAPPGVRVDAINRGIRWVQLGIPYSKVRSFEGYRQDCSGSVSMEWEIPSNPSTAGFAPYSNAHSWQLPSHDWLEPGDALNRVHPNRGHIFLFGSWEDESHQAMYVLEEAAPGRLMQIRRIVRSTFVNYAPIRRNDW